MSVVNKPIILSILKLLAQKYPQSVPGTAILDMIGQNRGHDIKKCLQYLVDKHYVVGVFSERGYVRAGDLLPPERESYRLTAAGIDYLSDYEELAEISKEIKRKQVGFQADNK